MLEVTRDRVEEALREVIDPEVGINIVDLGLVYGVEVHDNNVTVSMTMTTPACPMSSLLTQTAEATIRRHIPEAETVRIDLVWEPRWSPQAMSAAARQQLAAPEAPAVDAGAAPAQESSGLRPAWQRLPILVLAGVGLMTGMWGGLLRLGWRLPVPSATFVSDHGALMICGFLGTVIALERAVALDRRWAYVAPLLTGLGTISLLVGLPPIFAKGAIVVGAWVFVAASLRIVFQHPAAFTITMAMGAAALGVGSSLWWANWPVFELVWWWAAFLLLTIAGERLELSRLVERPRWASPAFIAFVSLFLVGVALSTVASSVGSRLTGVGMLAIAGWLSLNDVARHTVRQTGLTRYVAVCLLTGYAWLALCGVLLIRGLPASAGPYYDATLHSLLVGFVFSMIFGHAPIILPAVLRVTVRYTGFLYMPLALLHVSLVVRVVGDLAGMVEARAVGGAFNVLAIVVFLVSVVVSALTTPGESPGGVPGDAA